MTSIENSNDTFTWRKGMAITAACFAVSTTVGAPLLSYEVATACERRDITAPGGEASPAALCERNSDIRSIPTDLFSSLLEKMPIEPLFEDKSLEN